MDVKYFRLVKTITEEGSIAEATGKLFLSPSALSHQLKELENQLGFKLFNRERKKWQLTEEGKAFYQLGKKVLMTIDDGLNHIQSIKEGSKGNIALTTECYAFYQGLPKFIQRMDLLYPNINIELKLNATHHPYKKMLTKEIDLAIVTSPISDEKISNVLFFEDEVMAVMHKDHPLNKLKYLTHSDFSNIHLIIHSYPLETVSVFQKYLLPNEIKPKTITAIPLTEVALEMVQANMAIACMPIWTLTAFQNKKELVYKRISKNGLKRGHYISFRSEDQHKKYFVDFVTNFKEEFANINY